MIFNFSAKLYIPLFKIQKRARRTAGKSTNVCNFCTEKPAQVSLCLCPQGAKLHENWKMRRKTPRTARERCRPRLAVVLPGVLPGVFSAAPLPSQAPDAAKKRVCWSYPKGIQIPTVPREKNGLQMGTLFMLHGSIAHVIQKVYKNFCEFLSIPQKTVFRSPAGRESFRISQTRNL